MAPEPVCRVHSSALLVLTVISRTLKKTGTAASSAMYSLVSIRSAYTYSVLSTCLDPPTYATAAQLPMSPR